MNNLFAEAIIKPILLIIGLLGNSLTIFILIRRKSTTSNIYLLSIFCTDLFRLIVSNIRSLEYYDFIHINVPFFWTIRGYISYFGVATPLMSLLLIVSFTIDRYIALKNPLKRSKFNTKFAARCTVGVIIIFSLLATVNMLFNIPLRKDEVGYNFELRQFCNLSGEHSLNTNYDKMLSFNSNLIYGNISESPRNLEATNHSFDTYRREETDQNHTQHIGYRDYYNVVTDHRSLKYDFIPEQRSLDTKCQKVDYYSVFYAKALEDGHTLSKAFIISFGVTCNVLPLIVLIVFNTKLILLIRKMKVNRLKITQAVSMPNCATAGAQKLTKQCHCNFTISLENKSIIKLITMKAAMTICRLPLMILQFFYSYFSRQTLNILLTVVTILLDFNATLNFFIFCLLSTSFRADLYNLYLSSRTCCTKYHRKQSTDTNSTDIPRTPTNCCKSASCISTISIDGKYTPRAIVPF